ncbi:MAG: GNAT family N-acetyltransferase [Microbacterium sp.]
MGRRAATWSGGVLLAAAAALGALVVFVPAADAADVAWNRWMAAIRTPWTVDAALVLNRIGGGLVAVLVVPLLIATGLLVARRWRAAVFALCAFAGSALTVQLLKHLFGRPRPTDMLVASDYGSFPSGHTANAATIAVVLWLVLPRVWMALLGAAWTVLMALSRTVLSVHWLTDTVGGSLAGAGAALLVAAALWGWLRWNGSASVPADPLSQEVSVSQIRPFRPSDREALYEVCARTADAGKDATGILSDDRLWGDVWAVPYAEREPGLCWVVDAGDGRAIGYLVATDDTDAFEAWFRAEWWPNRTGEYPVDPGSERQRWVMSYAASRGAGEEPYAAEYPAHLHIDLLPEAQGQGLGRRLIETLSEELRRRGVVGVHLVMNADNTNAGAFYERLGMRKRPSGEGSQAYGLHVG